MSTDPVRLRDAFAEALDGWAAPAREHLPPAVRCPDGHGGLHTADTNDTTWPDLEETP